MRHYPSKLLLFGEYILLLGARALATPVSAFWGEWAWDKTATTGSPRAQLKAFADSREMSSLPGMDHSRLRQDLEKDLYFKSNIPMGYGLGSSGALCAAVYDRYVEKKEANLPTLKALFSNLEGYFHGQSSGIDPLTSYQNQALWITNKQEVEYFKPAVWPDSPPIVFLLDTKIPRQTGPLVEWFLAQSKEAGFAAALETLLYPAHEAMLAAWQNGNADSFWSALSTVAMFQLDHMQPMIPKPQQALWEAALSGNDILFKICGAGGGGFILGFARNKSVLSKLQKDHSIILPFEQDALVEK